MFFPNPWIYIRNYWQHNKANSQVERQFGIALPAIQSFAIAHTKAPELRGLLIKIEGFLKCVSSRKHNTGLAE
jgi:hypothetical protein